MLLSELKKIYTDAMIVEDIYEMIRHCRLAEMLPAVGIWRKISGQIELLIPEVAHNDIEQGKELLEVWKYCREEKNDLRELSYRVDQVMLPVLIRALEALFNPIRIQNDRWILETTQLGFLTAKDSVSGKYIHSPSDPMYEARVLADRIYRPEMDSFHILGCGLGYLPYQIWELSDHTADIYI